jgi:GntR family transcriptional regulator, rspAB operon transcriptional repressor
MSEIESNGLGVDRSRPLREQVYAILRTLILTGRLAPGASLEERTIAGELGISRTPVREAVRKLGDEGLVEIRAQSGTTVSPLLRAQVEEAHVIRRALEVEGVGRAAARMTDADVHRLEDLLMLHAAALDRHGYVDAIALDDAFHRAICDICGYPMLWRAVEISKAPLDRCRHAMIPKVGAGPTTLAEHRRILDALARRDVDAARQAMRDHLDGAVQKTLANLDAILA